MKLDELQYDIMEDPEYVWLWEMANISPDMSGVDHYMYISPENSSHAARVKVCNIKGRMVPQDMFCISLKDLGVVAGECRLTAEELDRVRWWIHRNRFAILDYWKQRINTKQVSNLLKPITEEYNPAEDEFPL